MLTSVVPLKVFSSDADVIKSPENFDSVVVVTSKVSSIGCEALKAPLLQYVTQTDPSAENGVFLMRAGEEGPLQKVVFSGTGPLDKDYDDVRCFSDAAGKGIEKALKAGSKAPALVVYPTEYKYAEFASLMGAYTALYVPLEMREEVPQRAIKADKLGFLARDANMVKMAKALEKGRSVSRDIGGSDPERMAPPRVEEYVRSVFKDSGVKIEVVAGHDTFEKEYPCLAAVNRAASTVARHQGRVIWLTYEPEGKVEKTAMIVGKGITYDTGGADIKAGGIMAGMSRDKCGAADAAGFMKTISELKPKNLKVVVGMAMVRNSVGSNCYVSDEIITSRAGVRIRVEKKALREVNPHLMTIATLTGHAVIAVGPYTAVMDNGPASDIDFASNMVKLGTEIGDPFEKSTIRREDYKMIQDVSGEYVDVLQCNNAASSRTPRGHQFPAAFMHKVSGLNEHMRKSDKPLKYSHLDVAGSSGDLPHIPTGSAISALTAHFVGF
ncbi:CARP [Lepeophtheirus salmonis]|uniref:CARP n=1 Tax=Lepeophtheirus salmonis TaxID=72036 RepID=A0A7R8CDQ0_LEPSM|nr:CARP [Lepeophtheirus salmonis]CAF2782204.1 CARP [Lepeophtheirus salmonis]